MALLLRSQGRTEIARSIYRDIYSENDFYYFYVARTLNWLDEEDPEQPIDSGSYNNAAHRNTMFVKRVQASDVALMIERRNWTLGTVYDSYDDAYGEEDANGDLITAHSGVTSLSEANFYVLTDELNVYKCIYNGGNIPSTVKPTGTDTDVFETSDGYFWKFMFRVEASDASKFLTSTHIPVRKMAGLGEPDFDVNGQIDYITVTAPGSGYTEAPFVVIQGDGKTAPEVVIDSTTGSGAQAFAICGVNEETNADEVIAVVVTDGGSGYKSAVNKSFDGSSSSAVTLSANTITISSHGFETGDVVTYSNGGGTSIGGLTNNRPYYIIAVNANTISLAVSETNASEGIEVDLTSYGTGGSHSLSFAGTTVYLLGGGGSGATATPTIVDGEITAIEVTDGGTGYKGARATCEITDGAVSTVTVVEPGSGFTFANVIFIPREGNPIETAAASATLGFVEGGVPQENVEAAAISGTIDRIEILAGGSDYVEGDAIVTITGDGQDAEAIVSLTDGVVTGVTITNPGAGYTFAEVTITNINQDSAGSGAVFRAVLSPYGGHGSNSQKELFAKTLSLTVSLTNESSDTFLNNDFRQVGVLINPRKFNSNDLFVSDTGNCCYVVGINNPDKFDYDDVIETDDGGRFIVVQKEDINLDGTVDAIHLLPIIPIIGEGSVMTNVTQDLTGMEVLTLTAPEVNNKSGEIMYIDNRVKIIRTEDQVEKVRALINF
jgi:hypothetical protein